MFVKRRLRCREISTDGVHPFPKFWMEHNALPGYADFMAERVGLCSRQFQKSQQQWQNRSIPLQSQILLELLQ
jgi:hypothetical protein